VLFAFFLTACCKEPWDEFPMVDVPSWQCRVGPEGTGYDLYGWDCVGEEHVVVAWYVDDEECKDPTKQVVPCTELTPLEQTYVDELGTTNCVLPPDERRWPGS
jgi:hypothetical protein